MTDRRTAVAPTIASSRCCSVRWVRAIRAYCRITGAPPPAVFHSNEGHAGFLGVERRIHAERR